MRLILHGALEHKLPLRFCPRLREGSWAALLLHPCIVSQVTSTGMSTHRHFALCARRKGNPVLTSSPLKKVTGAVTRRKAHRSWDLSRWKAKRDPRGAVGWQAHSTATQSPEAPPLTSAHSSLSWLLRDWG